MFFVYMHKIKSAEEKQKKTNGSVYCSHYTNNIGLSNIIITHFNKIAYVSTAYSK